MEGAGAEGRGGGSSASGGGNEGEEKQVVAAATASAGQAPSMEVEAKEGKEKREVAEEAEHQLVPAIPYTTPAPLGPKARSYTVLDLNGTRIEVRDGWRRSVLDYRLWCYNSSDKRYEFGHQDRRCCTLPPEGHFLIYMHYNKKWLCSVIDGPSGYLYGYITRSVGKINELRIRENDEKEKFIQPAKSLFIQHAKSLPWDVGYERAALIRCGELISAFEVIHRYVEEEEHASQSEEVKRAGETFILHFTEAGKSDNLDLCILFRNYRAGNPVGAQPILDARRWRNFCRVVYNALGITEEEFDDDKKVIKHRSMTTKDSSRKRMTTVNSAIKAKETLTDLQLIYRPKNKSGYLLLKNMPMQLTKDGPLDPLWAENELKESHKVDLDNKNWGFLTQCFPQFSGTNIDESTRKLLHNAYMSLDDFIGDKIFHSNNSIVLEQTICRKSRFSIGMWPEHKIPQAAIAKLIQQVHEEERHYQMTRQVGENGSFSNRATFSLEAGLGTGHIKEWL